MQKGLFFPAWIGLESAKKMAGLFPKPKGNIHVDDGASVAILDNGGSLLASGITQIDGPFNKADVVSLINLQGETIARGVSRFDSDELISIKGMNNQEILEKFPGKTRAEVIHRDHLAPHL